MVVEKTFHEEVAGHVKLKTFLCHMGREPLLNLHAEHHPYLVIEFYATCFISMIKHLHSIPLY